MVLDRLGFTGRSLDNQARGFVRPSPDREVLYGRYSEGFGRILAMSPDYLKVFRPFRLSLESRLRQLAFLANLEGPTNRTAKS